MPRRTTIHLRQKLKAGKTIMPILNEAKAKQIRALEQIDNIYLNERKVIGEQAAQEKRKKAYLQATLEYEKLNHQTLDN